MTEKRLYRSRNNKMLCGGGVVNIYGVESVEQIFYRNRGTDQ